MPIYEYRCRECGKVTEALVPMAGRANVTCKKCGSRKVERKFSTFATGGSGAGNAASCAGFT